MLQVLVSMLLFRGWTRQQQKVYYGKRNTTNIRNYGAFNNSNDAPIYVPDDSVAAYKAATNWDGYAARIFPISDEK